MHNKAIFPVLGVMRSGTSLVSQLLHTLGISMGEKWLYPPDESWQPESYWTDLDFSDVHDKLLDTVRSNVIIIHDRYLAEYKALIEKRQLEKKIWGIKCHKLPFLWPHFVSYCTDPVYLIRTKRDIDASIKSYMARTKTNYEQSYKDLEPGINACNDAWSSFTGPKLEIDFNNLIFDTDNEIKKLADFADVPVCQEAKEVIKPKWKRF